MISPMNVPPTTPRIDFSQTPVPPFHLTLAEHDLQLTRTEISTLQINVGLLCNQTCSHCHLEAGPGRKEIMSADTMAQVVDLARRHEFAQIDITGGAPEKNPNIADLISQLSPLTRRLMLRSNLTALAGDEENHLLNLCKKYRLVIVASFPSLNETQSESQRGHGVFHQSLAMLQRLNALGYGQQGSGLELNLVSNPAGAFLPSAQKQAEKRFRQMLEKKWGLVFNNLHTLANVPLGRFYRWLKFSGNLDNYMQKLASSFNACAVAGLMCRSLLSVAWDGYLYDCDFNQTMGLFMGNKKTHVSEISALPKPGSPIAVAEHCYTCTAGAGFT